MVELVQKLVEKGVAYKSEDGIYFSISKFKNYGKLAGLKKSKDMKPVQFSRIAADQYEKDEMRDFALWKFYKPEDGDVFWDTPLGKGRPGWHIECSAMSMKYLGPSFDIHTGGVDLIFPHHQNEIAQSEAITDKQFVKYWVHSEHLLVDGKKMSKSLGNIITLRNIREKGFSPVALRYFLLSGHYKTQMNFTWDTLKTAEETVGHMNDFSSKLVWLIDRLEERSEKVGKSDGSLTLAVKEASEGFEYYMDENLDTPQALKSVYELVSIANKAIDAGRANAEELKSVLDLLLKFNAVFDVIEMKETELSENEKELVAERERLRGARKYKEADIIRNTLHSRGLVLEDTPYGVRPKRTVVK
jgi:cysteinyl-tRNA synthetase